MRLISNYISVALLLIISLVLTYRLLNILSEESIVLMNNSLFNNNGITVQFFNNTKIILINKTIIGNILAIKGNYTTLYNSNDLLILKTDPFEKIVIITEGDIFIG